MAHLSLLTATSVILTRFFGAMLPIAGVGALRLSFGEVPIALAGLLFGPVAGGTVGALADIIGFPLNPYGGPYFPLLTLTSALHGVLPPLILRLYARPPYRWQQLFGAVLVNDVITAMVLQTFFLSILLNQAALVLLPMRVAARCLLVPVYTTLLHLATASFYTLEANRVAWATTASRHRGSP